MKIIFATNNAHKVSEVRAMLQAPFEMLSLKDAGIEIDIPEPFNTLRENAEEKAAVIFALTGQACFSEDTGLEVTALNGEPGVRSARYAGEEATAQQNTEKLLTAMRGEANREAQFRTVICFTDGAEKRYFNGVCKGRIIDEAVGLQGFGYDPIFIPDGAAKTFAQMTPAEKSGYSHRRKAIDGLVKFLNQVYLKQ